MRNWAESIKLMVHEEREEILLQALAQIYLDFKDRMRSDVFDTLTDAEMLNLQQVIDATCHQGTHGFRVTFWDDVSKEIKSEVGFRQNLVRARELNLDVFCLACDGVCQGDEEHFKNVEPASPEVIATNEMSRDDLIQEVIKLRNLK